MRIPNFTCRCKQYPASAETNRSSYKISLQRDALNRHWRLQRFQCDCLTYALIHFVVHRFSRRILIFSLYTNGILYTNAKITILCCSCAVRRERRRRQPAGVQRERENLKHRGHGFAKKSDLPRIRLHYERHVERDTCR